MTDSPAKNVDVFRCRVCAAVNVAEDCDWCLCTGTERTLMCSQCHRCFCDAPAGWKRDFWMHASPHLIQRRKGNSTELPRLQLVETDPARPVILLIDDDRVVHAVVPRVLAGFSGTLLHAYDGAEGLAMAQSLRPDLVLTDALMPKVDGRKISHVLKHNSETCRLKVVVMTSLYKGARYRAEAFREFDVDEFLEKPISAGKLRLIVESMLHVRLADVTTRSPLREAGSL